MRYLLPSLISLPTVFIVAAFIFNQVTGLSPGMDVQFPHFLLFPILAFALSVAGTFVKQGAREWLYAAILNGIPIVLWFLLSALSFLLAIFFYLIGYGSVKSFV